MNAIIGNLPPTVLGQLGRSEIIVLAVLAFVAVVTLFGMWMGWQEMKQKQQTVREAVRLALEKGQPLPDGVLDPAQATPEVRRQRRRERGHYELMAGLILLAVAGGLLFLARAVSPLVALVGLALLVPAWRDLRADRVVG